MVLRKWVCDEFPIFPDDTKGKLVQFGGLLSQQVEGSDGRGVGGIVFCDTVSSGVMFMVYGAIIIAFSKVDMIKDVKSA